MNGDHVGAFPPVAAFPPLILQVSDVRVSWTFSIKHRDGTVLVLAEKQKETHNEIKHDAFSP